MRVGRVSKRNQLQLDTFALQAVNFLCNEGLGEAGIAFEHHGD
jgi:hypothetical protein